MDESGRTGRVAASVVDVIGATPAVELSRLTRGLDGRIVAKLEYLNPGFSKKDRIARQIVDEAIASGELRPGQTVVELTSGNTGTGLAIVCAVRGHPFVAVMSEGNSRERARMMRALGAEVVLVPQADGSSPGQVSGADEIIMDAAPLLDSFGRVHDNLRIKVTERCNIRCFYCMPETGVQFVERSEILDFEEIERFVRVAVGVAI